MRPDGVAVAMAAAAADGRAAAAVGEAAETAALKRRLACADAARSDALAALRLSRLAQAADRGGVAARVAQLLARYRALVDDAVRRAAASERLAATALQRARCAEGWAAAVASRARAPPAESPPDSAARRACLEHSRVGPEAMGACGLGVQSRSSAIELDDGGGLRRWLCLIGARLP